MSPEEVMEKIILEIGSNRKRLDKIENSLIDIADDLNQALDRILELEKYVVNKIKAFNDD